MFLEGVQARATGGGGVIVLGEVHRCGVSEGDLKKVYPKKRARHKGPAIRVVHLP